MNSKTRRSSRARMANRLNRRARQTPVILKAPDGKSHILVNRAARKQQVYFITHAQGLSAAQEGKQKRKANQKAANRVLRKMRKETKRAMRMAEGA